MRLVANLSLSWPLYINVWRCEWLFMVKQLQLKGPLELFVNRKVYILNCGSLYCLDMTKADQKPPLKQTN